MTLPPVPVDDVALAQLEHAMGAMLTFHAEDGTPLEDPRVVNAEYTLNTLLEFWSGTREDPHGVIRQIGEFHTPVFYDPRPQYSPPDVMRALIAEIRRLRGETHELQPPTPE